MRKSVRRAGKTLLMASVIMLLVTLLPTADSYGASTGNKTPKATNVKYVTDSNGKKTGIKAFTISPYTYTNLSQDSVINSNNDSTIKLDDAVLLKIAKQQIFPKWGVIAEGIFRNQANQLVTIEGSGLMSSDTNASNSFDRHFSNGRPGVNGYSADWARSDLAADLASGSYYHKGKRCWDETRITGPTQISSLADARDLMGQELRNCSDDDDVSKDEFLGNSYQKNDSKRRLPDLADTKSGNGFANIVTCVNRAGASGDYDYVTFGLAVYDFDITPVAAQDLKYIEAADDDYEVDGKNVSGNAILMGLAGNNVNKTGITFQNDDEEGTTSYLRNLTTQEVTQSAGLENSVTEENTISTDETYEWGMEQQIGLELNLGGFGQGIVGDAAAGFAAPCMFPRATLSLSNSWHELWSTTKSTSDTKSATKTKTTNTELTLPGHTIAVVKQSTNNKRTTENYQQPVILNYKVAVFAMSGDYYNGASGGIESSSYDKQWMSVLFDGSDDVATSGCYALGSLYNRGITNKDTLGYDGAKGKYRSWCDKAEWSSSNKIDWNSISSTLASDYRKSHRIELGTGKKATTIGDLATELPLLERAQMLTSKRESVTSSVEQIVALYPLDSVSMKTGAKQYVLVPRGQQTADESDKLYLDQIKLEGYDKDAADFYEFDQDWGEWKLLDDEGDVIEDGGAKDESTEKGVVKSGLISIVTDENLDSQWVQVARASGSTGTVETHNIQWKIKHGDDAVIVSNESLNRENNQCMTDVEKDKVKTPVVEITVKNRERDVTNFEIDGTYKGPWNEEINLGHYISAVPVDQSGKISGAPVYWESKGTSGVEVTEDGSATFSKKGTYMVRPYSYNVDDVKIIPKDKNGEPIWIEVTANEKPQLSSIVINKPELDEDDATLTQGTRSLGFDLESYTKFYDQYGDKIEGTEGDPLPTIRYSVSPGENTQIDDENILTVTRKGTYTVSAKAYDKDGNDMDITINPIKITVKEDNWLDSITFDQPAMSRSMLTLSSSKDYVVVENLKSLLTYTDQNEDEWTGKKPNVTFSVDGVGDDAEIKGGNFYAYAPGTYIIEAHAKGFRIDPIFVVVTEESSLVLKTEDPGKQFLYTEEDSIDLELERYVDASTSFGGKWKGKVPALKFTLDSDVEDAKIETRTVYDGDDDYNGEDRTFFKTNTTGEFTVHVEPLKASEYSEPIDDIHIRVVKGKKIASIGFKNIDEELGEEGRMVDLYNSVYPKIDLSKYINVYDGFGEVIDPAKDHVRIPDVNIELAEPGDYPEGSYDFDGRVIKAYEGGTFIFKATMNVTNYDPNIGEETEDTILEAYTPISILEIDWCHDFGEWETAIEPTCTEDGIRVKRCNGGDKCINHEKGECDAEIEDVIPATGHAWSVYYSINKSNRLFYNKCDHCGIVNEDLNTSYPAGFVPDNGYININGEDRPMPRDGHASCTRTAEYYMASYRERIGVEVPAVGHAWDTKFTVVKEPSCVETGLEVIKCTRRNCNAVREGEEYQRIIPKIDHVVDESAWAYDESDGIELKETCENYGWQKNKCTVCSKDMYRPVAPTGHKWAFDGFAWTGNETDGYTATTANYVCERDNTHTETVEAQLSDVVTEPTCEEGGKTTYTATVAAKASPDGQEHSDSKDAKSTEALKHTWGDVTYTWSEDNSKVTAKRVCGRDDTHVEDETVDATPEITQNATCTDPEMTTWTSGDFENEAFEKQEKTEQTADAKGHKWKFDGFTWTGDETDGYTAATANYVCEHNSEHKITAPATISEPVVIEPTCTKPGKTTYTATVAAKASPDGKEQTDSKDAKSTEALKHTWGDVTYTWSEDNSKVTAKRVCGRDDTHVEDETVDATPEITQNATCTDPEKTTWTSGDFENKAFEKQEKTEQTADALGHKWDTPEYKWASDYSYATAKMTCKTNMAHVETETVKTTDKVTKKATYTTKGETTYTATFSNSAFKTQTKTVTNIPKLPQNKVTAPTGKVTILNTIANSSKKTNDVIWDKSEVKGAGKYELSWKSRESSKWLSTTVGNVSRGKTTGLSIGGLYDIRVRPVAISADGKRNAGGSWSATVYRYFHTTGKIRLSSTSRGSFTMRWAKNPAATGYQIMFTTNKNGSGAAKNINTVGASITSFTKEGLRSGTTYYVQIREIKKVGSATYIGNISTPVAVKVK